jgi:hypothetical protein
MWKLTLGYINFLIIKRFSDNIDEDLGPTW